MNHNFSITNTLRVAALAAITLASLSITACGARYAGVPNDRAQRINESRQLAAQGQSALRSKDYDDAIKYTQQAVTVNPDFGAAWNNLGLAFMQRGRDNDYIAAQQSFQKAASLLPSDPTPYRNLGLLYQSRGFEEDALRNFENALLINEYDIQSLRGATQSIKLLHKADPVTLDRLRRAQMIETDPAWLDIIKRERIRVQNELDERAKG